MKNVTEELKKALKEKNADRLSVVRMLHAAIKNREIECGRKETGLSEEETASVVAKEIKKRKKAIDQFKIGGRQDLVDQYEREITTLEEFLNA